MAGFNKERNKIVVVHYGNVMLYPPVLNLLENLLKNDINAVLIAGNTQRLPDILSKHPKITVIDIKVIDSNNIFMRVKRRISIGNLYRRKLTEIMDEGDIVWSTTDSTVRVLNKRLLQYKHIMQLMELDDYYPLFNGAKFLKFDLARYAKAAWKTVVPEINRAYIQKTNWKLDAVPFVLPNKPYYLDPGPVTDDVKKALSIIENEKRKIIMYMGVMSIDRNLSPFADAVEILGEEYCFYALGSVSNKARFDQFLQEHSQVRYLGFFDPPSHLHFLKYAYIGVLPYVTNTSKSYMSPLNVLYCAPNKIYEYAGYGVPMIGTDVLGLRLPFEKYNIGVCCCNLRSETIITGIRCINVNYSAMKENCLKFYYDTNLDAIVHSIIFDEKK